MGIKLLQHRAIERELADIGRGRLGRQAAAGRDWSCNRRSGPRPASPPAGRSDRKPAPAAVPAGPAVRRWTPRRGCRRANTAAKRGSSIRASTSAASASRSASVHSPALRARYPSAASRRRATAMSGRDCSSRCTSVPRKSARARRCERFAGAEGFTFIRAGIGRAQPAVDDLLRRSRGVQPFRQRWMRACRSVEGGAGLGRCVFRSPVAFHHAVASRDFLENQV